MKKISLYSALLFLAACAGEEAVEETAPVVNATSVRVIELVQQPFAHYFEVHGTVQSEQNVLINAEMPGLITSINVQVGDEVKAGATLAVIDQSVISNNIAEVETSLVLAQDVFQRQQNLWDQGIGSELQYLQAKNRVDQLEGTLATLKAQRSMAVISAPFSGIVDEVFAREGEMATGQFPVLRLVNLSSVYIEADVSERYLKTVNDGMEVKIEFPSIKENRTAIVSHVGQYISPANRTFKVRIDLDNPNGYLKPNLLAYVSIMDQMDSTALVVSTNAISDRGTDPYVFIAVQEGSNLIARKTMIREGITYDNHSTIISGLKEGAHVILDHLTVEDGTLITERVEQ